MTVHFSVIHHRSSFEDAILSPWKLRGLAAIKAWREVRIMSARKEEGTRGRNAGVR